MSFDTCFMSNEGRCCCNCRSQQTVMRHPWNDADLAKGPVSTVMGWGCSSPELFDGESKIIFFQSQHGICELHEYKEGK